MSALNTVGLIGGEDADASMGIVTALAASCGLNVDRAQQGERNGFAGFIFVGDSLEDTGRQISSGQSSFRVIPTETTKASMSVRFGAGPSSPFPFRGRSIVTSSVVSKDVPDASDDVIATADGRPVWTTAAEEGSRHDTCWVPSPWTKRGDCVFDHLKGSRLMNLLPLLEWLRWISGWHEWSQPPLRACFMFDDPNLHSTRYGFVNFGDLADEGKRHRYHTSFATVPLDCHYVNDKAAQTVRDNKETLSLLVHGNNHTYRELAQSYSSKDQAAQMRQAAFRIEQFERKAGLPVSRVMAPPHGVCSAEMMAAMMGAGFEAVCVSHGSVWTGNPGEDWTVGLGTSPATVVAGLPVIARFSLDRKLENKVLLAAYLGQPIIPVGHHWDLADGTDILSWAAGFINGVGSVAWSDLATLARNNYRLRIRGQVMHIQTFSRKTTVNVPEGVSELELEAPWLDATRESIECRISSRAAQQPFRAQPSIGLRFRVTSGTSADLVVVRTCTNGEQPHVLPSTPLRVIARRVLGELRDRSMPYLPRRFVKH